MRKMRILTIFLLSVTMLLSGCKKDEIDRYSAKDSSLNFDTDTQFSFAEDPDAEFAILKVPVTVMGPVVDYDRKFTVTVDTEDEETTAEKGQYEIQEGIVKANELKGELAVKVFNAEELLLTPRTIVIKLNEGDDFQIGIPSLSSTTVMWTASLVKPKCWNKIMQYVSQNSIYSTAYYQLMIDVLGTREINYNFAVGRDEETLKKYPYVDINALGAMVRQIEDSVARYNKAHPGKPMLHSADGARYNTSGVKIKDYPNAPIVPNPYNL